MNNMSAKEEIVSKLVPLFENRDDIVAVYLFGSIVTGYTHSESDIDIAILTDPIDRAKAVQETKDFTILISDALDRIDIDVVILNHADLLLRYNVIDKGEIIFEGNTKERIFFEQRTLNEYLDTLPLWEEYDRMMIKRLKDGTFGDR